MNPILITYTTKLSQAEKFLKSAEQFNWPVKVLTGSYLPDGCVPRFVETCKLIKELVGSEYTHAIMLDAYDVLVVRNRDDWFDALEKLGNKDLIISAETNCYPEVTLKWQYPKVDSIFKYVNSQFCVKIGWEGIEEFEKITELSDQTHMAKYYLKNQKRDDIILDTECVMFQNLYGVNRDVFDKDLKNTLTNNYPIFFHGNGKTSLDWI